jgi:Zn-dependent protease with chaperone function
METKRRFPGLSPRAYEHPSDRAALTALRSVPGFDTLVRKMVGAVGDRALRLVFLASAVRINERQRPDVYGLFREACDVLDVDPVPELFVAQTPLVNAGCIGVDRPFIVLNSGTLALLEPAELQFVLAHELGHVLSGHALYKTMLHLVLRASTLALGVPLGGAAWIAIATALLEWDRCSELSADRAGLLVSQAPPVAIRTNMKLAGGGGESMNVDEFVRQAEEYHENGSITDSLLKLLSLLGQTHPFPVLRLAEVRRWSESEDYARILAGTYRRRSDDMTASMQEDVREASHRYRDALGSLQRAVQDALQRVTGWGGD